MVNAKANVDLPRNNAVTLTGFGCLSARDDHNSVLCGFLSPSVASSCSAISFSILIDLVFAHSFVRELRSWSGLERGFDPETADG